MSAIVLCYHKVGPIEENGRWLNVEGETLRSHIRFLLRRRRYIVPARDLDVNFSGQAVLTFDDCYASTLNHGLTVLLEEGVQATFFAVSTLVGATSEWDSRVAAPLATWHQLHEAHRHGMEIGNHTASHSDLFSLPEAEVDREWRECHLRLSDQGFNPTTACYPFGKGDDERSHRALHTLGYKYCFALKKMVAVPTDSVYSIPRVIISYGDRIPQLLYKLHIQSRMKRVRSARS